MAEFNGNEQLPYFNLPPSSEFSVPMRPTDFDHNESVGVYMDDDLYALADFDQVPDFPNLSALPASPNQSFNQSFEPGNVPANFAQPLASPTTSTAPTSPVTLQSPAPGTQHASNVKRNPSEKSPRSTKTPIDPAKEELSVSAEEDKRRRNTAASARFRVKKKQREQLMEKTAKEMTEKCTALESRIKELEKENRLLKGLLTEKASGGKGKSRSESSSSEEDTVATRSSKRVKSKDEGR